MNGDELFERLMNPEPGEPKFYPVWLKLSRGVECKAVGFIVDSDEVDWPRGWPRPEDEDTGPDHVVG